MILSMLLYLALAMHPWYLHDNRICQNTPTVFTGFILARSFLRRPTAKLFPEFSITRTWTEAKVYNSVVAIRC